MDDFDFVRLGDAKQTRISVTFSSELGGTVTTSSAEGIILLMILKELRALRAQLAPAQTAGGK